MKSLLSNEDPDGWNVDKLSSRWYADGWVGSRQGMYCKECTVGRQDHDLNNGDNRQIRRIANCVMQKPEMGLGSETMMDTG